MSQSKTKLSEQELAYEVREAMIMVATARLLLRGTPDKAVNLLVEAVKLLDFVAQELESESEGE
ncbi:MAG: hypothetical protein NZ553_10740 [Caldilinea sp.]|nr:hypothetical protein [Caldilinea sp.]MDW8440939.1 hypothetical protein [Caldilineaceae bacterium]